MTVSYRHDCIFVSPGVLVLALSGFFIIILDVLMSLSMILYLALKALAFLSNVILYQVMCLLASRLLCPSFYASPTTYIFRHLCMFIPLFVSRCLCLCKALCLSFLFVSFSLRLFLFLFLRLCIFASLSVYVCFSFLSLHLCNCLNLC